MQPVSRVVLLCLVLIYVDGYPGGAPQSTCDDITPRHGDLQPQASASPYTLSPALQRVTEGNKLRLLLNSPDGDAIKGFMVQARAPGATSAPLGTFSDPSQGKTLTCGGGIRNTLTHKDNTGKKSVELEWEPPAGYDGSVVFNSTFVKDGATFWVGVESEPVQVVRRSLGDPSKGISTTKIPIRATTVPNYTPPRPAKAAAKAVSSIYSGCEDKKLCFGFPDGCVSESTCTSVVTVAMSPSPPNDFTFELLGTGSPGYISVGLSDDGSMGDDNVVECTSDQKLSMSTNTGKSNSILLEANDVNLLNVTSSDGNLYCRFTRTASSTVSGVKYDLVNSRYFLMVAQGPLTDNDALGYHDTTKAVTGSLQALTEVGIVGAKSNLLYRLHGAFMLAAWIGFAGTGMLVARYFKKTWVGTQSCGKDIWFAWHRAFMVLTWTLTCAGFIVIFVEVGGWYGETSNPHGILGVITTALCFVQPFAATLRPAPSSPRRPFFNWGHWLIGNLSHLLGIITIFFARQLAKAQLPEWVDWIISAYVAFHFVMHILFSVTDCCSQRESDKRVNNLPMKELGTNARMNNFADTKRDAPQAGLRKFLLAIYLIVVLGLTVTLIVVSSLAPIEKNETVQKVVSFLMPNN